MHEGSSNETSDITIEELQEAVADITNTENTTADESPEQTIARQGREIEILTDHNNNQRKTIRALRAEQRSRRSVVDAMNDNLESCADKLLLRQRKEIVKMEREDAHKAKKIARLREALLDAEDTINSRDRMLEHLTEKFDDMAEQVMYVPNDVELNVTFVRLDTPEAILAKYVEINDPNTYAKGPREYKQFNVDRDEPVQTFDDALVALNKYGVWCFIDTGDNTVYFWINGKCDLQVLATMLGQAIGFAVFNDNNDGHSDDEDISEDEAAFACMFGRVCCRVADEIDKAIAGLASSLPPEVSQYAIPQGWTDPQSPISE